MAVLEEPLDSDEAELSEAQLADADGSRYEVLEEEPVQEQFQVEAAAPSPQATSQDSKQLGKFAVLAIGAVALTAGVFFAVKRLAQQKLPQEDKVPHATLPFCMPPGD